jgi:hypothetical protein
MITPLRWLTLALLTGSAFGLTDCKKNSEPEPDKRSQREIWLTTPGWNRQSIIDAYTTPAGVVTTYTSPASSYFLSCALDDLTHFNTNRTLTVDDGPIQCQPPSPPSTTTWAFATNETEIVFDAATKGSKIATLTDTTLALEFTEILSDGTTWVQTQTYVAR